MKTYTTDIAFSPAVKAMQRRLGSRDAMERLERSDSWPHAIDDELRLALAEADSISLASASADGQPYVQHRGGQPGFIEQIDACTLSLADYPGNRQYVSLGNFSENPRCCLLLVDYRRARRYKLWGRMQIDDLDTADRRRLTFHLITWERNCPRYLPKRHSESDVLQEKKRLQWKIEALEAEVKALKQALKQ